MHGHHQIRGQINPRLKIVSAFVMPRVFRCNSEEKHLLNQEKYLDKWPFKVPDEWLILQRYYSEVRYSANYMVRKLHSQVRHTKGPGNNSLGQCSFLGSCRKRALAPLHYVKVKHTQLTAPPKAEQKPKSSSLHNTIKNHSKYPADSLRVKRQNGHWQSARQG